MILSVRTNGAILIAIQRRSLVRMWTPAQDSRSAHGLLYLLLYGTTGASIKNVGSLPLLFSHDFACDSQKICDTSPGVRDDNLQLISPDGVIFAPTPVTTTLTIATASLI